MDNIQSWKEGKAKEALGQNFVYTILNFAGYKIYKFGIENFAEDLKKEIKESYANETNVRLMCMPDYVIVDPETKTAELIEVKYREKERFDYLESCLLFKYRTIKNYLTYWKDMTLVIALNVDPFVTCVRMRDVDWNIHLHEKVRTGKNKVDENWNFCGVYKNIKEIFPRVKTEHVNKAREILKYGKD